MNFDNTEQIEALAKLPPEPPKPAERSIWSLVPRAIAGGAAKVGAAAVDALDTVGDSAGKRKAFERQGLRAPETDLSTIATSARDFERDMRPDPVTAGTAEQLVYGAVSGLTAAGFGAVLGGAPGAAIGMGGAEGAATADDLRRQGVDPKTARAAGLVVGGVGAASVALPIAGQTLKATAGLYLAGGPAGYMAQQAAVSQILSGAGYAKIADQFDPLDPVGLAVSSLVPLPFAGYAAVRNVRAARAARAAEVPPVREPVPGEPVKPAEPPKPAEPAPVPRAPETAPEVVDAAMVHNLTLQRQRAVDAPPPAVVELAARPALESLPRYLEAEGERIGGVSHLRGIVSNLLRTYIEQGPELGRVRLDEMVATARGDSGFSQEVMVPGFVDDLHNQIQQSAAVFVRMVEAGDQAQAVARSAQPPTDPEPAPAAAARGTDAAPALRPLEATIEALAQSTDPATRTLAEGLRMATRDIERLQAALPAKGEDAGSFVRSLETAAKEVDGARKAGQTLADYLRARDGADMPAAVNNLMIGLAEAARSPKRVAALVRQLADAADQAKAAAEPQSAGDVTANAVERMRTLTDEQLVGSDAPAPKAGADALVQSVDERMAALEVAAPDMVVRLDADGNPITLRDELARIRREAAEGTDSTLGGDDAPLVQVAATCALSMGA